MSSLTQLYQQPQFSAILPSEDFARGFIIAVSAAPEIPMPEQWMPWFAQTFTGSLESHFIDELADALMNQLRDELAAMRDQKDLLPVHLHWQQQSYPSKALCDYLMGMLAGHRHLEQCWLDAWNRAIEQKLPSQGNEAPQKRLKRCLSVFTTLANPELALSQRDEVAARQLSENFGALWQQLPAMLQEYVNLAGEIAQALPNQFEVFTQPGSSH